MLTAITFIHTMFTAFSNPVNWKNTLFLSGTLLLTLTAAPAYIWAFGLDIFQVALFIFFFAATGLSITLGYHRLFSHQTFRASRGRCASARWFSGRPLSRIPL